MNCARCGGPNPTGMRFCGHCGRPLRAGQGTRERRRVSVLFVDLVGFSNLVRDHDPEVARDLADEVLTRVAAEIESFDGYVDTFRGDGLVALFGAPRAHADDAERAVRAAATCLQAIREVGEARGLPLQGRAGVNTGTVIAGALGSGRIRDYTVMGSAVNLAARLERAASPDEVWVGPDTYADARFRLSFTAVHGLTLAGFPDVTSAYRLVPPKLNRAIDPFAHLTLMGREAEVAFLLDQREQATATRSSRTVWVVGDAGIGKSRLVRNAFRVDPDGRPSKGANDLAWLRAAPSGEGPWRTLAASVLGTDATALGARSRVEARLAELLPNEPRWRSEVLESLDLRQGGTWERPDRRAADRTVRAWRDLVTAYARTLPQGLVLVADDEVGESDVATLLSALSNVEAPLLAVRITRDPSLLRSVPPASVLPLGPLHPSAAERLVTQLAAPPTLWAARALIPQLGGVPAHLIELGRALSLQEDGAVASSLAALLQARLDRLPTAARTLLAAASLVGERVWDGLLRELALRLAPGATAGETSGAADPWPVVQTLLQENLLVAVPGSTMPGQQEFRFQSELLRRAVKQTVPYADRPEVHLRVATWLEDRAPVSFAEMIGGQFAAGGAHEAAYANLAAAAERAVQTEQPEAVDALYQRTVTLNVSCTLRTEASLAWAQAALDRGAGEVARRALALASSTVASCDDGACERMLPSFRRLVLQLAGPDVSEDQRRAFAAVPIHKDLRAWLARAPHNEAEPDEAPAATPADWEAAMYPDDSDEKRKVDRDGFASITSRRG